MAILKIERGPGSGNTFFVDKEATIGRDASQVTIHLADAKISGKHARIVKDQDNYYIEDDNSKNHTFINGRPIDKKTLLEPGDYISMGCTWLCFGEEQEVEKIAKQLPAYEILQEIEGVGGMGHYFKVRQLRLDRIVTLQLLPPNIIRANPHLKKKFRQQARSLAKLNHENIAIMLDFEAKESYLYVTSEYIDGEPLSNILRREKLSLEQSLEIGMGIANGIAHAHSQGVIHQDIHPANVMICERRVILGGFGVGAVLSEVKDRFAGLIGKSEYFSPEQASGREVDYRTDIYSFGVLLYELFAGRVPFTGTPDQITAAHLHDNPPALTNFNPRVPAEVEKLVYQCLEKESENRPQDVEWIANTLENILLKHKAVNLAKSSDVQRSLWLNYVFQILTVPIVTWTILPVLTILVLLLFAKL